jgi:hypothetical protein
MCENCRNEGFGRRDILKFGAAAAVALGLSAASRYVSGPQLSRGRSCIEAQLSRNGGS